MSDYSSPFLNDQLSKRTFIFGLRLWSSWESASALASSCSYPGNPCRPLRRKIRPQIFQTPTPFSEPEQRPQSAERQGFLPSPQEQSPAGRRMIHIDIGKDHRITFPERGSGGGGGASSHASGEYRSAEQPSIAVPEVSHLGWGHWYTLRELEAATGGFADNKVIGEGGYGIVYHGVLEDNTQIAVKNLLNNRGQAEKEFEVEVEAIGRIRHKNLVRLLGYCAEGAHRMLVYEYVDNGNLEQWLHGSLGSTRPLSWDIRMNIILGTAKGLMYLHEGLEPKVVHRDVKSSNILIDRQWNPKVSDFGLAKLLGSEKSYITTRVMGTFGYVAPEYAKTGMLNEKSDVYSFGILIMEIISGRNPVDYSRPPAEELRGYLGPQNTERPPSRALKKALLVALKCVDPDSQKRPKMGHVIHMFEVDDFPYRDERRVTREAGRAHKAHFPDKEAAEAGGSSSGRYDDGSVSARVDGGRELSG
ncbi:unnamed protein product [Spirodela intermedia]|uniref:non-specific serine/threonine protein kinase n=1 Tax=Spirodela intermedia TaxID=51605 RepID=A0A7I8JC10_SPIIN|nr:unnamed protein product [Spirodela intermedia]CAA6667660.1 unnamed protein product [Spirodela intermedia]